MFKPSIQQIFFSDQFIKKCPSKIKLKISRLSFNKSKFRVFAFVIFYEKFIRP